MLHPDRNRLDRKPTRGERWLGIILSALLALVFLPSAAFVFVGVMDAHQAQVGLTIFASVLAMIGIAGAFLFYRIAFTSPQAASFRAHQIYARIAVVVSTLLVVLSLAGHATTGQIALSFVLLFGALAALAYSRRKDAAVKQQRPQNGAL